MRITIHQPAYLPWLGVISKIQQSDMYICLDHVQYSKNSFDNRNKILVNGQEKWLTIPVKTKHLFKNNPLNKVKVVDDDKNWRQSHWDLIRKTYCTPQVITTEADLLNKFQYMYSTNFKLLFDYAYYSTQRILDRLDIYKSTYFSSLLDCKGKGSDLILEICKKCEATEYLSGPMGKEYLDKDKFEKEGIKILYHSWNTEYNLSAIHYLFTLGKEKTLDLLDKNYTIETY